MGLWESALILFGIGILSSKMEAGVGLGELGTGIQTLIAAPLTGTGTGLSSLARGFRDVFETFGDLGRGISAVFESIPSWAKLGYIPSVPGMPGLPTVEEGNGNGLPPIWAAAQLIPSGGGDKSTQQAGGGANVPKPLLPGPPTNGGVWGPVIHKPVLYTGGSSNLGNYRVL